MKRKMECPGCTAWVEREQGRSIGQIEQDTGWSAFFNCRNGLETVYVCPDCTLRVKLASTALRRVFGKHLSYIHMSQIAKLSEEK